MKKKTENLEEREQETPSRKRKKILYKLQDFYYNNNVNNNRETKEIPMRGEQKERKVREKRKHRAEDGSSVLSPSLTTLSPQREHTSTIHNIQSQYLFIANVNNKESEMSEERKMVKESEWERKNSITKNLKKQEYSRTKQKIEKMRN